MYENFSPGFSDSIASIAASICDEDHVWQLEVLINIVFESE